MNDIQRDIRLDLIISLPSWVSNFVNEYLDDIRFGFAWAKGRMDIVSDLAMQNVVRKTGGPFAAAVFNEDHELISVGVNCVVENNASIAHAEIMALMLAQQKLGTYKLPHCTLVTNVEPCIMCAGAIHWAEIYNVEWAVKSEEAEKIGFDEGTNFNRQVLYDKGVNCTEAPQTRDFPRKAAEPLYVYKELNGEIY